MRLLKWVSLGLGALVALVVLGVLVVVWLVDPNSFKSNIEAAVRERTGREFTLSGDIELGFFPWLSLRTGEGKFGSPAAFGPEPLVTWKSARLGVKLIPLLRGQVIADRVFLSGADLRLVRRADGSANWLGLGGATPAEPDPNAKPTRLNVDGLEIENSHLSFVDEATPRRLEITGFNLTTGEIAPGEPFTGTEIDGVLHMDGFAAAGVPFRLEVPEAKVPADFSAVDVEKYSIAFGGFQASGAVRGTLGEQPRLAGVVMSNDFDLRALLAAVGSKRRKPPIRKRSARLASAVPGSSTTAQSASIRSCSISMTPISRDHSAGRRARMRSANFRCPEPPSRSRATFRRPILRANPSCFRRLR